MATLKSNDVGHDNEELRGSRLQLIEANLLTYCAELGFSPESPIVLWGKQSYTHWIDVLSTAALEDGQLNEAYQEYHLKFAETRNYFQGAKDLLRSIIEDLQKNDDAMEAYGIMKPSPTKRLELVGTIEQLKKQDAIFKAAGDPRVLPDMIVVNLVALKDQMQVLWAQAIAKKELSSNAYDAKKKTFAEDTDKLRVLYNTAKFVWGPDSAKLNLLGFVPRSEVWTATESAALPAPKNFTFNINAQEFKWDEVAKATGYLVEYKPDGANHYTVLARTTNARMPRIDPFIGKHDFRVCALDGDYTGEYCPPITVEIHALAPIANFRWESADEMLRWDIVEGATDYLVLANDEPFGEIIHVNFMHVAPDPEADLKMQVWATNGYYATPRTEVVVIPKAL